MRYRAAVLGSPIAHSLSPALHEAGYAAAGLSEWDYGRREVGADQLAGVVHELDDTWRGLSLTMPLKEAAFDVAVSVSEVASAARAINTLVRRSDGGWDGDNTDVHGIVESLRGAEHTRRALVLGAGATARSAVVALRELGTTDLTVAARRPEAAAALVDFAADHGIRADIVSLAHWSSTGAPVIVSTLPGAAGKALAQVAEPADWSGTMLFDVSYAPWPSALAAVVRRGGGTTVSGLEMLIHQAARQFEIFTGVRPDIGAMRAAVLPSDG